MCSTVNVDRVVTRLVFLLGEPADSIMQERIDKENNKVNFGKFGCRYSGRLLF